MSITISFTMKPSRNWLSGNGWSQEHLQVFSKDLAQELGYHCEVIEKYVIYQFCPEGFLWMGWKGGSIVGDCQTNIAGPGFHAAVIHFLELYAGKGNLVLSVEDRTGYYKDRDFVKMRRNYFYQWFTQLFTQVAEQKEKADSQLVCWPMDYYLPEEKKGQVTTHIRPFSIQEISRIVRSGVSMAFAKDFFIWNEEEKDAYFYRNCALVLLNQECFFMPSQRSDQDKIINEKILELLEKALEMQPDIAFPRKDYLQLCSLAGREPVDISQTVEVAKEIEIGCRKGLLFRTIGCMRFAVPGSFLYDAGKGRAERYYDGKIGNSHEFFICAVNTQQDADFLQQAFHKRSVKEIKEFDNGQVHCKVAIYLPKEHEGRIIYSLGAQFIYKNQITIVSIQYDDPKEQDWAFDLIRKVKAVE